MTRLTCHALTPERWPDLAALFGAKGACDGCWCMYWRHQRGEDYEGAKGATNRRRFQKLVKDSAAHGALAYADGEPVGWIAFDRRSDFHRLLRARTLRSEDGDDAAEIWAMPCFYVKAGWRSRGVASALLDFAIRHLKRKHRATILEAYPMQQPADGKRHPAAFAYTGTVGLFAKAGFVVVGARDNSRQRMRLTLA